MPMFTTRIGSPGLRSPLHTDVALARKAVGLAKGSTKPDATKAVNQLLARAGYLTSGDRTTFDDATELAVKLFQKHAALPVTGVIDVATLRAMLRPRFDDLPDIPKPVDAAPGAALAALSGTAGYVDNGVKWKKQDVSFSFQNFTDDVTHAEVRRVLRDAFAEWSNVTSMKFYERADAADVDIRIRFAPNDGASGTLAVATWWYEGDTIQRTEIAFDEDETWSALNQTLSGQPIELFIVAVHEIGHCLGLGHSGTSDAVMYAYYNPSYDALRQDDINGITAKYGGDSTKNILADTAVFAPGSAEFANRVYVAWAGTDVSHRLNVMASVEEGVYFDKVTLGDTSPVGVSIAVFGGKLYLAWSGTGNRQLNVMSSTDGVSWGNKVTLGDTSPYRPVLAAHAGNLYIGWTGTDGQHRLNVMSSIDGIHWGNKHTLGDTSIDAPALASFGGRLYLGWTGTNNSHNLNVMSSGDGGASWQNKRVLDDTSIAGPSLYVRNGQLLVGWSGRDANHSLNVMVSSNGVDFGGKQTLGDSSDFTPVLVTAYGQLAFVWTGRDAQHHLNVMTLGL